MPRQKRSALSDLEIRSLVAAGGPAAATDGAGLTLTISAGGYAAWVLRYRLEGRRREYTIGPEADYPLERAREVATELRRRVARGEDISTTRRQQKFSQQEPCNRRLFCRPGRHLVPAHPGGPAAAPPRSPGGFSATGLIPAWAKCPSMISRPFISLSAWRPSPQAEPPPWPMTPGATFARSWITA